MPYQLADFEKRTLLLIKDAAGKLAAYDSNQGVPANSSIDAAIVQAAKHYSTDRPRKLAQDYAGAGGFQLPLPALWDDGFSTILPAAQGGIEYPYKDDAPDSLTIDDDRIQIYETPAGKVIQLLSAVPQVGETCRVHYTALHKIPTGPTSPPLTSMALTQVAISAIVLTGVVVSGMNAVYAFSSYTGPAPAPGMPVTIKGFKTGGNNVSGTISAATSGTFTLLFSSQVTETDPASATLNLALYSFSSYTGPAPVAGMMVAISGFTNPGNNLVAGINAVMGLGFTVGLSSQVNETNPAIGAVSGYSTIPDVDFDAVAALSAALALEQLASLMIQTGDPTLTADVVDYKSKSAQYLSAAKALRLDYDRLMGKGDNEAKAATAQAQFTEQLSVGLDRLTHMRRSRR